MCCFHLVFVTIFFSPLVMMSLLDPEWRLKPEQLGVKSSAFVVGSEAGNRKLTLFSLSDDHYQCHLTAWSSAIWFVSRSEVTLHSSSLNKTVSNSGGGISYRLLLTQIPGEQFLENAPSALCRILPPPCDSTWLMSVDSTRKTIANLWLFWLNSFLFELQSSCKLSRLHPPSVHSASHPAALTCTRVFSAESLSCVWGLVNPRGSHVGCSLVNICLWFNCHPTGRHQCSEVYVSIKKKIPLQFFFSVRHPLWRWSRGHSVVSECYSCRRRRNI